MVSPARSGKKNSLSLSHALPFIKPAVSADQALNISFSYWHISLIVATVGLLYFVPFYVWLLGKELHPVLVAGLTCVILGERTGSLS